MKVIFYQIEPEEFPNQEWIGLTFWKKSFMIWSFMVLCFEFSCLRNLLIKMKSEIWKYESRKWLDLTCQTKTIETFWTDFWIWCCCDHTPKISILFLMKFAFRSQANVSSHSCKIFPHIPLIVQIWSVVYYYIQWRAIQTPLLPVYDVK